MARKISARWMAFHFTVAEAVKTIDRWRISMRSDLLAD